MTSSGTRVLPTTCLMMELKHVTRGVQKAARGVTSHRVIVSMTEVINNLRVICDKHLVNVFQLGVTISL